jgi:hypothetical protein
VRALLLLRAGKGGLSTQTIEQQMASFLRLKRTTALQAIEFLRKRQAAESSPPG